jgi:chitinase
MVVGAAFYSRVWAQVPPINNGLYQSGNFEMGVNIRDFDTRLSDGFDTYWDSIAQAPYMYNSQDSLFATFDDSRSVALKTRYALDQNLGGIMFWELTCDSPQDGLLNIIYSTVHMP